MFSVTLLLLAYISSKVPISYDCLTALPEFTARGRCKSGRYLDNYELQHGSIRCRSAKRIINTSGLEKSNIQNASAIPARARLTWPLATRKPRGRVCARKSLREAAEVNFICTASGAPPITCYRRRRSSNVDRTDDSG